MKKIIASIAAIAALNAAALPLTLSCTSEPTGENTPSNGNGSYGSQAAENGQAYRQFVLL